MKKLVFAVIITLTVLSPLSSFADYNSTTALSYLQSHANSPWSTMALSLLNASSIPTDSLKNISSANAIDYEAPILAIAALNQDPRSFGGSDYVAKLESFHTAGQIGDPTTLNNDIFGILALVAAGQPLTDSAITDAKNLLLTDQNSDGGWAFTVGGSSDSNTTASAITALVASGVSGSDAHIANALAYLKTAQNTDGGFTYDPKSTSGTGSDSSSTAWVLWALNSLNIDQSTWSKGGNTPVEYLEGNQDPTGFFKFQGSTAEDSFSPVTTAYAVIALTSHTLPVHIFHSSTSSQTFPFRIEGSADQVCTGQTTGPTALDIVKNASTQCGFTYDIKSTSYGPYLDQINSDSASGQTGWLYLVDSVSPSVGAGDYQLQTGDDVLWYYGNYGALPTRLSLDQTTIASGQSAQATVEDFSSGSWQALAGATVTAGTQTFTTDSSGHAQITNQDGYYKVFASENGFIRSNQVLLQIGQPNSSSVSLTANISGSGSGGGQVQGTSTQSSTISFVVDQNSLDFGNLTAGGSASKQIKISNNGNDSLHIESIVSGDSLFTDNLQINNLIWQNFKLDLPSGQNQEENLKLNVPQSYSDTGQKNGQLVFWAIAN